MCHIIKCILILTGIFIFSGSALAADSDKVEKVVVSASDNECAIDMRQATGHEQALYSL